MRAAPINILLWFLAACGGGVTPAPPGQPTSQRPPLVNEPTAWSLQDTKAQLLDDLARVQTSQPTRRFVTVYYVEDNDAADLLADWFRRHELVAGARLGHNADATRVWGVGNRYQGRLDVAEQRFWELVIESTPGALRTKDVDSWVGLLEKAPRDSRWRLGPSMVERS